jgi:lysophospholipase L1-like esterase
MTLRLALLGDSIAYGVGAERRSDTLVERLRRELTAHGLATDTHVFAKSGARSSGLARQVRRAVSWRPDVAVFVIGANDLSHTVPPDRAAEALKTAVRALRAAGAQAVVAPAPDLSVVPQVPARMRDSLRRASALLRERQIEAVLGEGGRVADPEGRTSMQFSRNTALFSADRFHPSSEGYAVIAQALSPLVLEAALNRVPAAAPVRTPPDC